MVFNREKRSFNDKHATVKARFEMRRIAMEPFACIHIVTLPSESVLKEMFGKQSEPRGSLRSPIFSFTPFLTKEPGLRLHCT